MKFKFPFYRFHKISSHYFLISFPWMDTVMKAQFFVMYELDVDT
jgi:hypothetical protein